MIMLGKLKKQSDGRSVLAYPYTSLTAGGLPASLVRKQKRTRHYSVTRCYDSTQRKARGGGLGPSNQNG